MKTSMKYFFFLVFLLNSIIVFGQSSDEQKTQRLDTLFKELYNNKMSMGSINIYKNGKEFYSKTYGIANIKDKNEFFAKNETTVYRIGSLSKIFTAYMIMKLVENGKISLNQSIENYFPTLINSSTTTIEQLLLHKSSLPVFVRVNDLEKLRRSKTIDKLIAAANEGEVNKDTSKPKYNNLNYILLGLIVEKTSGKKYNDVLFDYLKNLNKPSINGTYSLLDYSKNEANSFHINKDKWEEDYEISPSPISDGSGFLLSNARTLNEFMIALFTYQLINKSNVEKMLPREYKFGYGLMKANFEKHNGFGHSGRIEGFTSATTYFPDDSLSVTFLQNGSVYPINDILMMVGNIMFDKPFIMPSLKKVELNELDNKKLYGIYANEEEGYKVIVDKNKGELRLRVAKGNGLLNKQILNTYALSNSRIFNPGQGIIFDFSIEENGEYKICEMRVNGAKLVLKK
jgi:D-alanyl-D-alanine carboxypeptidase